MKALESRIGGVEGLRLRLYITLAYSLTSLVALVPLFFLIEPVVDASVLSTQGSLYVLLGILFCDLVGQTLYNERLSAPVFDFLRAASQGTPARETIESAAATLLELPQKMALSSFILWMASISVFVVHLFFVVDLPAFKVGYLFVTGVAAALVVLVFQYALFRRLIEGLGASIMRHRYRLQAIRRSRRISARMRLTGTLFLLVFGALCFAGITSFGQYVKVTSEQTGVLTSATLANLAEELPAERGAIGAYLREQQRNFPFAIALWIPDDRRLIGQLPIAPENLLGATGELSGSFEHAATMSRVSFRTVGQGVLLAVAMPGVFLSGGTQIFWMTLAILFVASLGSLIVLNAVALDIVRPLSALNRFARDLSEGAIRTSPTIVTEDELGRLDGALRQMGMGLRRMFVDLKTSLDNVKELRRSLDEDLRAIQEGAANQDRNVDRAFMSFSGVNQALRDIGDDLEVVEKSALESHGSVRQLENYLDDIRSELTELLDTVRAGGRMILGMNEGAAVTNSDVTALLEGVSRLCAQIERMQTAFGELSTAITRVGDSSEKALETAMEAEGTTVQAAHGVTLVNQTAEGVLDRLQRFRLGVNEIAGVVDIIDDVTEQTSLLSFNAAILAAESHENHARDFAVVGDEIKDLFERTEASTKDVAQLMSQVHKGSNHSLEELRTSLGRIQQGQLVTMLARDAVQLIRENSERTHNDMRALREGIQYQYQSLTQLARDLKEERKRVDALQGFSRENSQDAQSLRASAEQLVQLLERLQRSTGDQAESNRHILYVLKRMTEGIFNLKRGLRKLSGGSAEVVDLMNEIRFASTRNTRQTEQMNAQLRKLDGLLKEIESKLTAISLA